MKQKHLEPLTPAALYARVSSDRQDVDLSVSAQLRALKEYARANGYSVAREYVDEAESGRFADRPQFREIIEEGSKPNSLSWTDALSAIYCASTRRSTLPYAAWTLSGMRSRRCTEASRDPTLANRMKKGASLAREDGTK